MRLELTVKKHLRDVQGEHLKDRIKRTLGLDVQCNFVSVYNADELSSEEIRVVAEDVFVDSITQDYGSSLFKDTWRIEVGMLPGVTDNVGKTASEAIRDRLGKEIDEN